MTVSGVGGNALSKILGLILLIVVLPIFAGLGMLSADYTRLKRKVKSKTKLISILTFVSGIGRTASAGIVSMGDIIIQFMPLFGIGADFTGNCFGQSQTPFIDKWIYPSLVQTPVEALPLPFWRDLDF